MLHKRVLCTAFLTKGVSKRCRIVRENAQRLSEHVILYFIWKKVSLSRIAENNDCPVRFYAFEGISFTEQLCITFVDHVQ